MPTTRKKRREELKKKRPEYSAGGLPGYLSDVGRNTTELAKMVGEIGLTKSLELMQTENQRKFLKGRAIGMFTAAPDVAGLAIQGLRGNPYGGGYSDPIISGNPIREAVGLDPTSGWGMLGEMMDPSAGALRGAKAVMSGAQHIPEMLAMASKPAAGGILANALFHGTPHKFDMFELEKIGTGEGAQAYGHGLYFAESPGVAKSYRNKLTDIDHEAAEWVKAYGSKEAAIKEATKSREIDLAGHLRGPAPPGSDRLAEIEELRAKFGDEVLSKLVKREDDFLETEKVWAQTIDAIENYTPGHLYSIEYPDELIEKMLDWDAPLSEQSESVRGAIMAAYKNYRPAGFDGVHPDLFSSMLDEKDLTGQAIYDLFAQAEVKVGNRGIATGGEAASKALNEAGIPGIRFFDGSSRSARSVDKAYMKAAKSFADSGSSLDDAVSGMQKAYPNAKPVELRVALQDAGYKNADLGTRNIVVFNPDDITQVKRDNQLVYKKGKELLKPVKAKAPDPKRFDERLRQTLDKPPVAELRQLNEEHWAINKEIQGLSLLDEMSKRKPPSIEEAARMTRLPTPTGSQADRFTTLMDELRRINKRKNELYKRHPELLDKIK